MSADVDKRSNFVELLLLGVQDEVAQRLVDNATRPVSLYVFRQRTELLLGLEIFDDSFLQRFLSTPQHLTGVIIK